MTKLFYYNGIKLDGKLYKGWYSKGTYTEYSGIPQGTITIYSEGYDNFPKIEGLQIHNDTDTMTDYFDKDKIYVRPDSKHYEAVMTAYNQQEEKRAKQRAKRMAK